MNIKPEAQTEIILWDWLMTKSNYVKNVYLNRKNDLTKIFNVKGTNGKKPDLIIEFDRGFGIEYIAVEVKNSNKSKDVYDACKILDYYESYFTGKAHYFIEGKEIEIKHFAIATDNSIGGYLLKRETEFFDNLNDPDDDDNAKYKRFMVEEGYFPRYEYYTTGVYLRLLWANWRRLRNKLKFTKASSIGILISEPKKESSPHFFTMVYCDWNLKKRWGQRFWKL